MRAGALALVLAGALGIGACGDDDEKGPATVTVTQTQTAPTSTVSGTNRCPDIVITPNSGDGVFDITTENVACAEATSLLRSSDGLRTWDCRVIAEGEGRKTTSCSLGDKVIVFATEA
ncbi:MAG: hypothetical protein M3141_07225 [Actinomycetota bacterium]|nr:hypothetical protein [Actinomycetota bacterium]